MPASWDPPTATLAVWEAYVKREKNHKAAWKAIPAPKPSYSVFSKIAEKAWGPSQAQMARRGIKAELVTVKPISTAPAHPIGYVRSTDRALALVAEVVKENDDAKMNCMEAIGRIRSILLMHGVCRQ